MKWQPIETAPKDGTAVLLYAPGHSLGVIQAEFRGATMDFPGAKAHYDWYIPYSDQDECGGAYSVDNPTHWMPLPEPPKEGE